MTQCNKVEQYVSKHMFLYTTPKFKPIKMLSENVFNAMEAGEWQVVKEIITTAVLSPADLEKKHGV